MGWKISDKVTVEPQDTDLVLLEQNGNTRNSTLARIKKFLLGDEILKTTAQTIKGAINENTTQLSDVAHKTGAVQTNLNADLLDGQHGAYYAPLASPNFTGVPTISSNAIATNVKPTEIMVTLLNGFTTASGSKATYCKTQDGIVTLNIFLNNSGSSAIGTTMFTLPAGYKFTEIIRARGIITSNAIYIAEILINTDGTVKVNTISSSITSYTNVQFDVSFVATA